MIRCQGRGYTLIELMVTIVIISILASLSLAGLAIARQRVKADRTEITIRKIHEVIMPHFERFMTRTVPSPSYVYTDTTAPTLGIAYGSTPSASTASVLQAFGVKATALIAKRRMLTLELPDSWKDLVVASDPLEWRLTGSYDSGISRRLRSTLLGNYPPPAGNPQAIAATRAARFSDAECLWLSVMRGGYADPAIIGHFRDDEFGDNDEDGQREFIDGWGNPIRFLRWAPAFVSKYQPLPDATSTETRSHDAFDPAGLDPLARNTLFPLIFSGGPDGEPDILCRDDESGGAFTYPAVGYDPFFVPNVNAYPAYYPNPGIRSLVGSGNRPHQLTFTARGSSIALGEYPGAASQYSGRAFGSLRDSVIRTTTGGLSVNSDDIHNHAMSR